MTVSVIIQNPSTRTGKTETAKIVMKFLADRSRTGSSQTNQLQEKILNAANPLLESFGNATTIRNGKENWLCVY
jgi:myosin I